MVCVREEGGVEESTTWEQHRCDNRIAVGFAVIEGSEAKEFSMSEPRISGWRRWRWTIDTFLVVAGAEGCASRQFIHFIRYLVCRSARFRACFCDSWMKWIWSAIAARRRAFARLQSRFLLQNLRLHVLASRKSTLGAWTSNDATIIFETPAVGSARHKERQNPVTALPSTANEDQLGNRFVDIILW